MAINATKYQLTHLLQDAWIRMGQLKRWKATGGTAATVINTTWAGVEEPVFEDDDPALIYGTVVVMKDTAGAAPEGEMGMITDYDSASSTITMETLSGSVAVNDRIGIASPQFPFEDMIELANLALQKLGEIDIPEYVNVTAGTISYTLPSAVQKRPTLIRYISPTSAVPPRTLHNWFVMPDTSGVDLIVELPNSLDSGGQLEVFYRDSHPTLTAFDSQVIDIVNPELAVCALVAEAYQWYNNQLGGANQYFLQRENKAIQDLEQAMVKHPVPHVPEYIQGLPHWGIRGDYVPGTSDLRA